MGERDERAKTIPTLEGGMGKDDEKDERERETNVALCLITRRQEKFRAPLK